MVGTPARRSSPIPITGEPAALGRCERVAEAFFAVVHSVVVRHRCDIHTARRQRREGARRGPEHELLRRGRAAARDGRLEVDHGEVGTSEDRADRGEDDARSGPQLGSDVVLEVHVTSEGEYDRLPGRRTGSLSRRGTRLRSRWLAAVDDRADEDADGQSEAEDGDGELCDSWHEAGVQEAAGLTPR